jgi:hypothetical protein
MLGREPGRFLEMKNTMEVKNSTESFNSRIDQSEKNMSDLGDRTFEVIHSEEQKDK